MNEAPEGLEYGDKNKEAKYGHTPINDNYKELGKIETGRDPSYEAMHKAAEALRMKDGGCCDPMYVDQGKNT